MGIGVAVYLIVSTWQVWLLFFTALIVAAAILPAARWAERYRIPRGATVLAVYLGFAGVLSLMGGLLWPALAEQWSQFTEQLPKLVDNVRGWLGSVDVFLEQWGASLRAPKPDEVQGLASTLVANTLRVTAGVVGFVVGLLAIVVIAAYLVVDARTIGETLLRLVPRTHRSRVAALGEPVLDRIGGYVLAIGMAILGVKYALLIGALAAVFNVVPFVGSFIAAVLGILSALNESLTLALATAGLFWGTNLLEGKLLAPHFVGRATGLHPLAVLLALFAGVHMGGLVGALVSVPLLAGAWEIVRRLYLAEHESA